MDKHVEAGAAESDPKNPFPRFAVDISSAWLQPARRFASAIAAVNAEIVSASRRLEAQGKAWEAYAKCTDLPAFTEMQGRFLANMAADYTNEAADLARRMQDIMSDVGNEQAK